MTKAKRKDNTPVGIDTDILIQAYRKDSDFSAYKDEAQRAFQRKFALYAERLIDRCRSDERPIYLSTITVGEFLVKEPVVKHASLIRDLENLFTIVPFNLKAASLAANIVAQTPKRSKAARDQKPRMVIAADIKIIASLVAAGATTIYFHDSTAFQIAEPFVNAQKLALEPSTLIEYLEDGDAADTP